MAADAAFEHDPFLVEPGPSIGIGHRLPLLAADQPQPGELLGEHVVIRRARRGQQRGRAAGRFELGEQLARASVLDRQPDADARQAVAVGRGVGAQLECPEHGLVVGEQTHAEVDRPARPGAVAAGRLEEGADPQGGRLVDDGRAHGAGGELHQLVRAVEVTELDAQLGGQEVGPQGVGPAAERVEHRGVGGDLAGELDRRTLDGPRPQQHRPGERRPCRTVAVIEGVDAALGGLDRRGEITTCEVRFGGDEQALGQIELGLCLVGLDDGPLGHLARLLQQVGLEECSGVVEPERPRHRAVVAAAPEVGRGPLEGFEGRREVAGERPDVGEVLLGDGPQQRLVELLGLLHGHEQVGPRVLEPAEQAEHGTDVDPLA